MNNKKLPHQLSDEELLKLVEEGGDLEAPKELKDPILNFLQAFNIQPGRFLVHTKSIHDLYKAWSNDRSLTKRQFEDKVGMYIAKKSYHAKKQAYFMVNKSMFKFHEELERIEQDSKQDPTKSKKQHQSFEKFLQEYGQIGGGNTFIEAVIFYYFYRRDCELKPRKPLSYGNFVALCRIYFDTKYNNKTLWIGLKPTIIDQITPKVIENMRQGRLKYGWHQKKIKKKSTEIS